MGVGTPSAPRGSARAGWGSQVQVPSGRLCGSPHQRPVRPPDQGPRGPFEGASWAGRGACRARCAQRALCFFSLDGGPHSPLTCAKLSVCFLSLGWNSEFLWRSSPRLRPQTGAVGSLLTRGGSRWRSAGCCRAQADPQGSAGPPRELRPRAPASPTQAPGPFQAHAGFTFLNLVQSWIKLCMI